jgi:hypothetical protein
MIGGGWKQNGLMSEPVLIGAGKLSQGEDGQLIIRRNDPYRQVGACLR